MSDSLTRPSYIVVGGSGDPLGTPTILRLGDPPLWRFIVTNRSTETLTVLDKRATERGVVFALDQPATHTGLVPSDDPEINIPAPAADSPAFLSHNTRFIYGFRREIRPTMADPPWRCRFAGIVMGLEDVAADAPTSRYTAYDPWQYLMARPIRNNDGTLPGANGIIYTNARASDMALDLLANTIAVDGDVYIDASNPGLREDTVVIVGETKFDRGISVGEAWQQLCDTGTIDIILRPVYDPASRPGILCELVIRKQAGQVRFNAVMGWDRASRSLTALSRLIDGTRLANEVQFYAGQGGLPVALQSDAASVARYGEYWAQQFMVGKQTQKPLVELLALAQLEIRKRGAKSITLSPAPERSYLALRDYGLGDYVPVWASRNLREPLGIDYDGYGALSVSISGSPIEGDEIGVVISEGVGSPGAVGYQRLYAIPIEIDDNGVERPTALLTASESANSF
jgi:hypothetical protein